MIDFFINNDEIQISGDTQPSHFEDGDRNGYDLTVITNNRKLETYKFARLGKKAKPGLIPYIFEQNVFDLVLQTAKEINCSSKPAIVFLDEIGRLETMMGKGHHQAILQYLESFQNASKVYLIVTYNERRKDETMSYLSKLHVKEAALHFEKSNETANIGDFCNKILDEMNKQ